MTEQAMDEALDAVISEQDSDPSRFVAANGLILRLKRVSKMIVADADARLKAPQPPRVWITELEREEENPNHPSYLEAVRRFNYERAMMAMRVYLILGTEVEHLPPDLAPHTSHEWSDLIAAVDPDAEIPESGPRRYLAWLRLYAVPDEQLMPLLAKVARLGGATFQADVAEAQSSFRGDEERDTAERIPSSGQTQGGDRNGIDPGDGTGVRSQGSSSIRPLPVGQMDVPIDIL